MSNEIQLFQNPEFGEIRTTKINGEPWFVGKDVALALGYERPTDAARKRVDEEDRGVAKIETPSGIQEMTIINESGLYSLVLSSNLPGAKKFKRWVTSEVLPAIRKTGGYIAGSESLSDEELMAKAFVVAQRTLAEREKRIAALTEQNKLLTQKAEYFDELVFRDTNLSFRDSAKELDIKEIEFIRFLLNKGFVYRDKKGKLRPYARSIDAGLFVLKECFSTKTDWSGAQCLVTPKGRSTFRILMRKLKRNRG